MASQPDALAADPANEAAAAIQSDVEDFYKDDIPQPVNDADDSDPDAVDPDDGPDNTDAEDSHPEPELEPIAAPNSLTAEEKEKWGSLPREAQEIIHRRVGELERGFQQKTQEIANTKRTVETQAREAIVQVQNAHSQQLEAVLAQIRPQQPDERLLYTGQEQDRVLYFQQEAAFRRSVAQHQGVQQQLDQAREQARLVEQAEVEAQRQADSQVLETELGTEWTDPSARQKLLDTLQPIGGELGYPVELMAQANATDILALRKALTWKQGYEKWQAGLKSKMELVRSHKLPKVMQPGSSGGVQQAKKVNDPLKDLYPDD